MNKQRLRRTYQKGGYPCPPNCPPPEELPVLAPPPQPSEKESRVPPKKPSISEQLKKCYDMSPQRSYKAYVNGTLIGNGHRIYFHGTPQAAAKKVVNMLHKGHSRFEIQPWGNKILGINNAVKIDLIEVTKGAKNPANKCKCSGEDLRCRYFGWRETIEQESEGATMTKMITRAVPVRHANSASEAYKISQSIGNKIKDALHLA